MKLSSLDLRIIDVLQSDASLPLSDVAERVASSKSVVSRRIQALVKDRVIRHRVAIIDPKAVGLNVTVFAQVRLSRHSSDAMPNFLRAVKQYPQVLECHTLMGSVDVLMKIVVRDVAEYEKFWWHDLSQIEGVQEVTSSIAMSSMINTTRLPIPLRLEEPGSSAAS